jgi:molybdopterin converting factor small subunit
MAVTVRLPSMFHRRDGAEIIVDEAVDTVAELRAALARRSPELALELSDAMFNVAINDVMLLHAVEQHALRAGDVIEFIPTIAGG